MPSPACPAILTVLIDECKNVAWMKPDDGRLSSAELHGRQPRRWAIGLGVVADPTLTHMQQLGDLTGVEQPRAEAACVDSSATLDCLVYSWCFGRSGLRGRLGIQRIRFKFRSVVHGKFSFLAHAHGHASSVWR